MTDQPTTQPKGKRVKNPLSPHAMRELKHIRPGLAIYQTGASKFWYARWWHPVERRHIVRSTKETSRIEARKAAEELMADYVAKIPKVEKHHLFDHYAKLLDKHNEQAGKSSVITNDRWTLFNPDHGLSEAFGKKDIRTISASDIKDYLHSMDEGRGKPLTHASKIKFMGTLKKVLMLAADHKVLTAIPTFPKINERPTARVTFTEGEYKKLLKTARETNMQMYHAISFLVGSFLRPTKTELFALKNKDIVEHDNPQSLHLAVRGKTGERVTVTMPHCVDIWKKQLKLTGADKADDYVFFPDEQNRKTIINRVIRQFNALMDKAELKCDNLGRPRSMYSLRHYALQQRLHKSGGKVNIFSLAKNAGTSPAMLEAHYLKHMALNEDLIRNLHANKDD
ncbi:integrase [Paracoccus sp. SSK6]|uniref:integrase n=1 Tax=Paracoccus sp. SSK6 TaxID=3143131 RepID=UPI003219DFD4